MKKITIGIPAYNEEYNIKNLLNGILRQKQNTYRIEEIIVLLDGSTDRTYEILQAEAKKNSSIKIIYSRTRKGKIFRLNQLYSRNKSEYLVTLDADIIPVNKYALENLIKKITKNKQVAAANMLPYKTNNFFGKIMYANNLIWKEVSKQFKNADHISSLYGQATILTSDFVKSFKYPRNIVCDEEYLYIKSKEKNGFAYANKAMFYFKPPENFRDYLLQSKRFMKERNHLVPYFGKDILALHYVPIIFKIRAIFYMMKINPIFTFLAIFLNILTRIIPFEDISNKKGIWSIARSTKNFNL